MKPNNPRAVLTIGNKGGSSKSTLLVRLAEIHRDAQPPTPGLALVDGDDTVGTLYKTLALRDDRGEPEPDQTQGGVQTFALRGTLDERDRFANEIIHAGYKLILADLPATSLSTIRELDYDLVESLRSAGYRTTALVPITPYEDTTLDLQEVIEHFDREAFAAFTALYDAQYADLAPAIAALEAALASERTPEDTIRELQERVANARAAEEATHAEYVAAVMAARPDTTNVSYVAAVNLGMAEDRTDFELWLDPDSFTRQLFGFVGGVEIEVPKLRARIPAKLARYRLRFGSRAARAILHMTDASRLARWNADTEKAFRSAGAVLGF